MSRLSTALASAALLAGVGAGIVALHEPTEGAKPTEAKAAERRAVIMPWACPAEPERPERISCWTEHGTDTAYRDCTDGDRMGDCEPSTDDLAVAAAREKEQSCPMCIPDCRSDLPAQHEAAMADYRERRAQCPLGWREAGERCICYIDSDTDPGGAVSHAGVPREARRQLYRCEAERGHVMRWGPGADRPPEGCTAVGRAVLAPHSMRGVWTEHDRSMQEACAPYPIRPGDHGHCPACVGWPDECPPCRMLAERYGERWRGHEDECPSEGEI